MAVKILNANGQTIEEVHRIDGSIAFRIGPNTEDLDGVDLAHAQLSGVDAEGLVCMGTIFRGANLERAVLYWALAHGAIFDDANLRNATLCGAKLNGCSFAKADLSFA